MISYDVLLFPVKKLKTQIIKTVYSLIHLIFLIFHQQNSYHAFFHGKVLYHTDK